MKKNDSKEGKRKFVHRLLKWNNELNSRQMPWKGEKDPYKIWLSEIILQQTRVEQGLKYYNNFIKEFPDVHTLARAQDKKIFKLWEGLGYYSRCKNLIASARFIAKERKGKFPETYDEIKNLKGVGPYTASAIASFAFNLPYAVVDGNVFRVLARVFGINKPIDSAEGKTFFNELATELLDKKQPGLYNQAIMDFGAVVCKPALPLCTKCIIKKNCFAFLNNTVNELPVKEKKIIIKKRWFCYLVMEYKNKTVIRQRTAKDIWQQLYEFRLIETITIPKAENVLKEAQKSGILNAKGYEVIGVSPLFKQQLSHQLISGHFIHIRLKHKPKLKDGSFLAAKNKLDQYAFPKFINQYLKQKKDGQEI
jgi:A/G-specific adenine glycosylase